MSKKTITVSGMGMGIIAIFAGIMILVFPNMLQYIVGGFLIVWGIMTMINNK